MSHQKVYSSILQLKQQGQKGFAVLIDPDKVSNKTASDIAQRCNEAKVDYIFFGGSLMVSNHVDSCIKAIKEVSDIKVVLFPGSPAQISKEADALLYLSLLSGRNAELLIGHHVTSAAIVKASGLEVMSTGYLVVDGGAPTTVSYMSGSLPIPADKDDIALCTAMAGEMQGKKLIYMDAGSGAKNAISDSMLQKVSANISIPLIVGGGIREAETAYNSCKAGADIIVVGNTIEKNTSLIQEIASAVHSVKPANNLVL